MARPLRPETDWGHSRKVEPRIRRAMTPGNSWHALLYGNRMWGGHEAERIKNKAQRILLPYGPFIVRPPTHPARTDL